MKARSAIALSWVLVGCQAPLPFDFDVPADIGTFAIVSELEQGLIVDVFATEDPIVFSIADDTTRFWALGYRATHDRIGLPLGRVPLSAPSDPGRLLPIATRAWARADRSLLPLDWGAVDERVKALRVPPVSAITCFGAGGCYLGSDPERACVDCSLQADPAPPARPTPPSLPPCTAGDDATRFGCLFRGEALPLEATCQGLSLPSGCRAPARCGGPVELNGATIWVLPSSSVPANATTAPSLDAALSTIAPGGLIILGEGRFSATAAVPAGVQLTGVCPEQSELFGDLLVDTATLTDLTWRAPTQIGQGALLLAREAIVISPDLQIDGVLEGTLIDLDADAHVTGVMALNGAVLSKNVSVDGGTFTASDGHFLPEATLRIRGGGDGALALTKFEARPDPRGLAISVDHGELVAQGSVFLGTVQLSTGGGLPNVLELEDVLISVQDGADAYGLRADPSEDPFDNDETGPCPDEIRATVALDRVTVLSTEYILEDLVRSTSAVWINCSSLVAKDVMVNGFPMGGGIQLGGLGGLAGGPSLERAMITAFDVLEEGGIAPFQADRPPGGRGLRIIAPAGVGTSGEAGHLTVTDLTSFGRRRGLHVREGRQSLDVARVHAVGNLGSGVFFERFEGEVQLTDVDLGRSLPAGNDSTGFGHGLAICTILGGQEGQYSMERFSIHDQHQAGMFFETDVDRVDLRHGTIHHNPIGVIDARGEERLGDWLTEVRFFDNEVAVQFE